MFYFNGCAGIANAAIIFIFLYRQHKKDLSEVVTSQRWSPCYYDTGMNRGVPSLVSFATMQATHAIISIQPFPFVILVITSSDSHSHIPPFPPAEIHENGILLHSVWISLPRFGSTTPFPPTEIHGNVILRCSSWISVGKCARMRCAGQFRIKWRCSTAIRRRGGLQAAFAALHLRQNHYLGQEWATCSKADAQRVTLRCVFPVLPPGFPTLHPCLTVLLPYSVQSA